MRRYISAHCLWVSVGVRLIRDPMTRFKNFERRGLLLIVDMLFGCTLLICPDSSVLTREFVLAYVAFGVLLIERRYLGETG